MKTLLKWISVAVCLTIISVSCTKSGKEAESVTIGSSLPLTGSGANYGRSMKEGIDLAVDEINASNILGKPLKVIFEDDKMDPRSGVDAVTKLISSDKVDLIIGPFGSSITLAVAPIANRNEVVILGASATADSIAEAGDYVFRITPPNSQQGRDVATFCFDDLGSKKAAVVFQTNDYGMTLKQAFETEFENLGGETLLSEGVNLGVKDFRTQISKIKSAGVDVVFFPLHVEESGIFLKQCKELGLESKFVSCDGAMVSDLLKIAGEAAEGTYYTSLALGYGESDQAIKAFESAFEKKFSKSPDVYAAYYYEVTMLAAKALQSELPIKDALYAITGDNSYHGITGTTSFDSNGEVDKSFTIYVVKNNQFEVLQ